MSLHYTCNVLTCFSVRDLAFSLDVPISHTQILVLAPAVTTSLGLGQMAQRICPHSDRHSYTTDAWSTTAPRYRG